jgi:hypothetical protein
MCFFAENCVWMMLYLYHRLVKADFLNPTSRGGESLLKIFWKKSVLRDKIIVGTITAVLSRLIVAVILNWLA